MTALLGLQRTILCRLVRLLGELYILSHGSFCNVVLVVLVVPYRAFNSIPVNFFGFHRTIGNIIWWTTI